MRWLADDPRAWNCRRCGLRHIDCHAADASGHVACRTPTAQLRWTARVARRLANALAWLSKGVGQ